MTSYVPQAKIRRAALAFFPDILISVMRVFACIVLETVHVSRTSIFRVNNSAGETRVCHKYMPRLYSNNERVFSCVVRARFSLEMCVAVHGHRMSELHGRKTTRRRVHLPLSYFVFFIFLTRPFSFLNRAPGNDIATSVCVFGFFFTVSVKPCLCTDHGQLIRHCSYGAMMHAGDAISLTRALGHMHTSSSSFIDP